MLSLERITEQTFDCRALRGLWSFNHDLSIGACIAEVEIGMAFNLLCLESDRYDGIFIHLAHFLKACLDFRFDYAVIERLLQRLLFVLDNIS